MRHTKNTRRIALLSGLITAGCLLVPLVMTALTVIILEQVAHARPQDAEILPVLALVIGGLICGGLWGGTVSRVTGISHRWAMRITGTLALIPSLVLAILLTHLMVDTGFWLRIGIENLPEHQGYMVMFGFSVFLVSTLSTLALSATALRRFKALPNAVLIGLTATVVYVLVVLIMDVLSYRIGSGLTGRLIDVPPMPFVTIVASGFSALAGGAVLGVLLHHDTVYAGLNTAENEAIPMKTVKA